MGFSPYPTLPPSLSEPLQILDFPSAPRFFFKTNCTARGRCIRPEVFCKKGALKNFAKFTGKTSVPVSFLIVEGLRLFYRTSPMAASGEAAS